MDSMSHILIIEDDPSLVELLRYNLENEGFEVSVARDGEEGLESVATQAPDLVVLDWMLP
ncbi:MAG: response regulator, partial [Rhodospirillales bacterium]